MATDLERYIDAQEVAAGNLADHTRKLAEQIDQLERDLEKKDEYITSLEKSLEKADARIEELEGELKEERNNEGK